MTNELETLAVYVHGAGAAFNGLGVVYNARRRQWFDTIMNLTGFLYHSVAAFRHARKR